MSSFLHNHTHLTTEDVEKTVDFYTQVMDAKIIKSQGNQMADIDLGGVTVRISSSTGADSAWQGLRYGLHHLGLTVSNMEEFATKLKSKGGEFVIEPFQPRPEVKIAFAKTPDNVLFEIVELKDNL